MSRFLAMAKKEGSSKAQAALRKEQVWRLALRGYSKTQILEGLRKRGEGLSERTLTRDLQSVRLDLLATIQASELYSLKKAFAELEEVWRELWSLYARSPMTIESKRGKITVDDRGIKTLLLREIRSVVHERAQLLGYFTPKVMERITLMETAQARGVLIEKIPWEDQLRRGVEELKSDEGLARSQGITDQALPQGSAV
jgi:hypothetical protein